MSFNKQISRIFKIPRTQPFPQLGEGQGWGLQSYNISKILN